MMERIDLSAVRLSDQRRDAIVARVLEESSRELMRRAGSTSPILVLGMWARPALAAAAILAAVCGTMLTRTVPRDAAPGTGIAEALGVSTATTRLLAAERTPTVSDLIAVTDEAAR